MAKRAGIYTLNVAGAKAVVAGQWRSLPSRVSPPKNNEQDKDAPDHVHRAQPFRHVVFDRGWRGKMSPPVRQNAAPAGGRANRLLLIRSNVHTIQISSTPKICLYEGSAQWWPPLPLFKRKRVFSTSPCQSVRTVYPRPRTVV